MTVNLSRFRIDASVAIEPEDFVTNYEYEEGTGPG